MQTRDCENKIHCWLPLVGMRITQQLLKAAQLARVDDDYDNASTARAYGANRATSPLPDFLTMVRARAQKKILSVYVAALLFWMKHDSFSIKFPVSLSIKKKKKKHLIMICRNQFHSSTARSIG
jgi:hypothetical protein